MEQNAKELITQLVLEIKRLYCKRMELSIDSVSLSDSDVEVIPIITDNEGKSKKVEIVIRITLEHSESIKLTREIKNRSLRRPLGVFIKEEDIKEEEGEGKRGEGINV